LPAGSCGWGGDGVGGAGYDAESAANAVKDGPSETAAGSAGHPAHATIARHRLEDRGNRGIGRCQPRVAVVAGSAAEAGMATVAARAPGWRQPRHLFSYYLPDLAVVRRPSVQLLVLSRTLSKLGMATLSYGGKIHLARTGAPQIAVTLLGATQATAALLFGTTGGAVVDSLSTRIALVLAYAAQAAFCVLMPTLFGDSLAGLIVLVFVVGVLSQVTSPALKAATALVATAAELATVSSFLALSSSIGTALGSTVVAPLAVKVSGVELAMYLAGAVFALAAVRALQLPGEETARPPREALRQVDWKHQSLDIRATARWIVGRRAIASMILAGAAVSSLNDALNTLLPVYVRTELKADPADTVYIFAPGAIGFVVATVVSPRLIKAHGERWLAVASLVVFAIGAVLFGVIGQVAPLLAPMSPMHLLAPFGFHFSQAVLAAGVIAIPFNFGATASGSAVQTYVNRRVPLANQGATFGIQSQVVSAITIVTMLSLGALATVIGVRIVFLVAAPLESVVVALLVRYGYHVAQEPAPTGLRVLKSYWEGSSDDAVQQANP
jgi:MFS family permease